MKARRAGRTFVVPVFAAGVALAVSLTAAIPSAIAAGTTAAATAENRGKAGVEEVRSTFRALREALSVGDGGAVLDMLSADTRDRLKVIQGAARGRVTLNDPKLAPSEKLMAGALERALGPSDLRRHDLSEVLTRALKRPGSLRDDVAHADLGAISVVGDDAHGTLFVKGAPTMIPVDFTRENGRWRFDLTRTAKAGDMVLAGLAGLKGVTTDALIESILSRMARGMRKAG